MDEKTKKPFELPTKTSLDVIESYLSALAAGDSEQMNVLRAEEFELDFVQRDAFQSGPLSSEETRTFWQSWFAAFSEMDYYVTRTIAADTVVVTQWTFMGTHTTPLDHPIFDGRIEPTGKTICFRGISVYDVQVNLIKRETTYMDLSTLFVELGVTP